MSVCSCATALLVHQLSDVAAGRDPPILAVGERIIIRASGISARLILRRNVKGQVRRSSMGSVVRVKHGRNAEGIQAAEEIHCKGDQIKFVRELACGDSELTGGIVKIILV